MARAPAIPRYFLYGEPPTDVELDFLHVEPIRVRSGAHDWQIAPHAHPDHTQILLVQQGSGAIRIDGIEHRIAAPALIVIPSGLVHAISFSPDTDGVVATIARAYLDSITRGETALQNLTRTPRCYNLGADWSGLPALSDALASMMQEFVWQGPGRRVAIAAHLMRVLVTLLRLEVPERRAPEKPLRRRNRDLVDHFRELIERHFRTHHKLGFYAGQLHIPPARLNTACHEVAGKAATQLLMDRIVIEAKRHLLYTNLSIAEISSVVGFDDPAYFCRVFTKRAGLAPSHFREASARGSAGTTKN